MDEAPGPDQYEERLKEVFDGFDASATGSLSPEELSALCYSLQLGGATPTLLHTLLQNQDGTGLSGRVDFHQFKNALIQVLSSTMDSSPNRCPHPAPEPPPPAESPEIQPKFVKGSKRYGRRSTPEFLEPLLDFSEAVSDKNASEENEDEDSAIPRKRERCNPVHETSTEEYEAEGQMTLWNPDEPGTPRGSGCGVPLSQRLEVRLQEACEDLSLPWNGPASLADLLGLADHLGLEVTGDVIQSVREAGGEVNVREFVCRVVKHSQPTTPSSSTPYRQLKRLHSTQPFDEAGRRMATPSMMTSSIGLCLFSTLDDGTGHAPVENLLDAWLDEGIENTPEILKALDFSVEGRVNLGQLTCALENELLVTRNGLHQAALASFKAEIRHLLERLDLELQEKERLLLDLEKAERLKNQLAAEVDENHSVIERSHHLTLRKLEQEHKEKLGAVRSELLTELDQIQQQANLQREELEAEVEKSRADESFMRDHLSISIKENCRLETEVLDGNEKLAAAQLQISKLQASLENVLREKLGDLDPGSAELFRQEERFKQLCSGYEAQCRELQDRIDELQSEQALHSLGRRTQPCSKPLSDELESKSPGMESDPGLGTEEGQPFNMSLEAEMMLEQLKEQHGRRVEDLQAQLESKILELDQRVEEQRAAHEGQKASISSQHQEEIQALREQMSSLQTQARDFQTQLEQARLERVGLERKQAEEREELELQQEEVVATLRQRLLEAHTQASDLEEQLATAVEEAHLVEEVEELKRRHALELRHLQEKQEVLLEARLEEERMRAQEAVTLLEEKACEEKERLRLDHGVELSARLEEAQLRFEEEKEALVERLTEEWRRERAALEEQSDQTLQEVLEAGMLRLVKEQEEKESRLRQQWEEDRVRLQKAQEEALLTVLAKERLKHQEQQEQREKRMKAVWEEEKLQLEEDYEGMLQDRLKEEREKAEEEKEEEGKRFERMLKEETSRLEERHREAVKELSDRHGDEREELGSALDRLREEIIQERKAVELHFFQRIKEVEGRFSGDQDSVAERFQADVLKLEQHYQAQLRVLSEAHTERTLAWRAEMDAALLEAEEQRRLMREAMEQEKVCLNMERADDREELENARREEVEVLLREKRELERELEDVSGSSQTKERDLNRQLIELHKRLQESQASRDDLLAASERKVVQLEVLLSQAVEDFKQERAEFVQERAELQSSLAQLQEKYEEAVSLSEERSQEKIEQFDGLKNKIEDLETMLQHAMVGFEFERLELLQSIVVLEDELKDNLCCLESLENERVELISERDQLNIRITEMGKELNFLSEITMCGKKETSDPGNMLVAEPVNLDVIYLSFKGQETKLNTTGNTEEDYVNDDAISVIPRDSSALDVESESPVDEEQNTVDMRVKASIGCSSVPNKNVDTVNLESCCSSTGPHETSAPSLEQHHDYHLEMRAENPIVPGECPEGSDCVVVDDDEWEDSLVAMDSPKTNLDDLQEQSSDVREDVQPEEEEDCFALETFSTEGPPHRESLSKHNTANPRVFRGTQSVDAEEETEQLSGDEAAPSPDGVGHEEEMEQISGDEAAPSPDGVGHEEETEQLSGDEVAPSPDGVGHEEETEQISGDEASTSPEAVGHEEERNLGFDVAVQSWDPENNPQDSVVEVEDEISDHHVQRPCHAIVVELVDPEEAGDCCGELTPLDLAVDCSSVDSHKCGKQIKLVSQECGFSASLAVDHQDEPDHCEAENPMNKLQVLYSNAIEENILLHQKISLLQQKTVTLESILTYNNQKLKTGGKALEENLNLKLKLLSLTKRAKDLESKVSELDDIRVRYDDGRHENVMLKEQNGELKQRLSSLESRLRVACDFQGQHRGLVEEISTMRRDNVQLSELVREMELQGDVGLLEEACTWETASEERSFQKLVRELELQGDVGLLEEACTWETPPEERSFQKLVRELELQGDVGLLDEACTWETPPEERSFQEMSGHLEARTQTAIHLEVCCEDLEVQNADLRGALASLQGKALTLSEWMQVHRSEISRLEEENTNLSQKITALKDEDLKGINVDLQQKLDDFQKEKIEAENMTEDFQKQILDLNARGHHLQEENVLLSQENGLLSEKNLQNSADVEEISQQLAELIQENERREAGPAKDKIQMAACVAALEAELTKSLEEAGLLEEKNIELEEQLSALGEKVSRADMMEEQLSQLLKERRTLDKESQALRSKLARAQEKVEKLDKAVKTSTLQASHLKTDLRVTQQEKDALRQEVLSLHKQLQNAHNKVKIMELAFHSGEHKKFYREELSLLQDQEEKLLKQENQRLQVELLHSRADLVHCREKVRQLETTMVSLKQQNHAGLVKVLEQENSSLKKQLEVKNDLSKSSGGEGESYGELESLRQENEVLKAQTARLSTQLIEAFQAQLVGLLPGSPHRAQRGPHRGEDPDNMQDERERKMKKMEERMKEIELTLHNVKLLLRDKVSQLKDQLHKNGRADVLIQDLYVENGHLLKALQRTEQQQQMVEKKNYLLEQKISSLSKIMRDLSPAPPSPASYRSKCS